MLWHPAGQQNWEDTLTNVTMTNAIIFILAITAVATATVRNVRETNSSNGFRQERRSLSMYLIITLYLPFLLSLTQ
jgi:hypothetical protein